MSAPQDRPDRPTPLIEDYALIGSTHSAALVHRDGTIAWLCLPRFDSEAFFASLLGGPEHGGWALRAADPAARVSRRYLPDTLVLETTFETADGRVTVLDFMPPPVEGGTHELVRIVQGVEGRVAMRAELRLRFNYGRARPWLRVDNGMIVAVAGPDAVRVSTPFDLGEGDLGESVDFVVEAHERLPLILEWYASHTEPPLPREPFAMLRQVEALGRRWVAGCLVDERHAEVVRRSLLTLKAMTYRPSGAIAAAPTTSLPETFGGERNWDYRYCWLRDAVLTLYAFLRSGLRQEASDWRWWLMRAAGGSPEELQIMYGLQGERRLTELVLDHLPGFADSRPVRIGNAAADQCQLDVYGSVLAAFNGSRRAGLADMDAVWPLECALAGVLAQIWRDKDSGLWESRGDPQHHVHSKVMCWLAFDRMVASARDFHLEGPVEDWTRLRDEIHAQVCAEGFDAASNSFVRHYGAADVDAALLQLPMVGFLPVDDPRILGTIARVERELMRDGVVYRYVNAPDATGDGLRGTEGAFLACSFWLCDAYALTGRLDEATALFDHLLTFQNDVGLYAEEIDPVTGRQLGNFPQAFSHFALVNSARTLADARRGVLGYLARRSGEAAHQPVE